MAAPYDDLLELGAAGAPVPSNFIAFWGDDPAAWHTITIARVKIPGISIVKGKGFDNRLDRQKIPGTNGQRMVHVGYDPADFVIKTKLWTAEQLGAYIDVVKIVKPPRKGAAPQPVEIVHPSLTLWGVTACLVLSGGMPEPNKEESPDWWIVELRCIEYVPTSKQKGTVQKASRDLTTLGPGAVGERAEEMKRRQSPAAQNRTPNSSQPDQNYSPPLPPNASFP